MKIITEEIIVLKFNVKTDLHVRTLHVGDLVVYRGDTYKIKKINADIQGQGNLYCYLELLFRAVNIYAINTWDEFAQVINYEFTCKGDNYGKR